MQAFVSTTLLRVPYPLTPLRTNHCLSQYHQPRCPRTRVQSLCATANQSATPSVAPTTAPPIQLMACDIDGTLLSSSSSISPVNIAAVKRLLGETDVIFVPATGKSRKGALNSLAALGDHLCHLYPTGCPGVFLQGLVVFGIDGSIIYENSCSSELSNTVVNLSHQLSVDLIGYNRDTILTTQSSELIDTLPRYGEPAAKLISSWDSVIPTRPINKFILIAPPHRIDEIRPHVASAVGSLGHLTQAQPDMLEVLPPGASKGYGVKLLLNSMDISPDCVLAIGDAENDLELLSMVRYSCAVDNALPAVKKVAKFFFPSNNDNGVATAIERFLLKEGKETV